MSSKSEENKLLQYEWKLYRAIENAISYGILDVHPLESPNIRHKTRISSSILRAIVPNTPDNIRRVKMIHIRKGWSFIIYGRGPYVRQKQGYRWSPEKDRPPVKECPYVAIYQKETVSE